jgi:hypothetical protein
MDLELYATAKEVAACSGVSLTTLVSEGLRKELLARDCEELQDALAAIREYRSGCASDD